MLQKLNKSLNNIYNYSGYIAAVFLILIAVFILTGIASRIFGFYIRGDRPPYTVWLTNMNSQ